MAGTLTVTQTIPAQDVTKHSFAWTCDASGVVSGTSATLPSGTIIIVAVDPGTDAPTNLYDAVLLCDDHGVDVLAGEGANLLTATSAHKIPLIANSAATDAVRQWLHGGGYTLGITNAGVSTSGVIDLYISRRPL
jgi:hypothetical protein